VQGLIIAQPDGHGVMIAGLALSRFLPSRHLSRGTSRHALVAQGFRDVVDEQRGMPTFAFSISSAA